MAGAGQCGTAHGRHTSGGTRLNRPSGLNCLISSHRCKERGVNPMPQVSMFRLYVLRAMYVFMFVGLAIVKWPTILKPPPGLSNSGSVVGSVLGAISLLALLGIRYPVKMLPLLFFLNFSGSSYGFSVGGSRHTAGQPRP